MLYIQLFVLSFISLFSTDHNCRELNFLGRCELLEINQAVLILRKCFGSKRHEHGNLETKQAQVSKMAAPSRGYLSQQLKSLKNGTDVNRNLEDREDTCTF